jgi:hypothetical protein
MAEESTEQVERFRATNGRLMGALGLGMCAFVAGVLIVTDTPHVAVPGVIGCALLALVIWMALLRPSVAASPTDLHLRTLFESVRIPLASIDTVLVRRYLLIRSGGEKYICPAISRPLRKTVRSQMKWNGGQSFMQPGADLERLTNGKGVQTDVQAVHDLSYPDFVEQRITALAATDRARRGIEERSEEEYELGSQVEHHTAWLELGGLAVLAVVFVLALVVF